MDNLAIIILAAGQGTRLNHGNPSPKPKILFEIGHKPIIFYTLETVKKMNPSQIIIVVGYQAEKVKKALETNCNFAFQEKTLGTANAAECALPVLKKNIKTIMVLNGDDSAFYKGKTLQSIYFEHKEKKNTLTFVTLEVKNPSGLGRIIRSNSGKLLKIVEEKNATDIEKQIHEVNDGCYIFDLNWFSKNISEVRISKIGEYYLTDMVEIALSQRKKVGTYKLGDISEWVGINSIEELEFADKFKRRIKKSE